MSDKTKRTLKGAYNRMTRGFIVFILLALFAYIIIFKNSNGKETDMLNQLLLMSIPFYFLDDRNKKEEDKNNE